MSVLIAENLPCLIADIGGTNARFALFSHGLIHDELVLGGIDYPDFVSAYKAYLEKVGNPTIKKAAVAIANPIDGDRIKMTNHSWSFSIEESRVKLQLDQLIFKNDFAALALSIPYLKPSDFYQVGGAKCKPNSPIGVLGPGTGLGVSGLIQVAEKHWIPIEGEGGHVSFSPTRK